MKSFKRWISNHRILWKSRKIVCLNLNEHIFSIFLIEFYDYCFIFLWNFSKQDWIPIQSHDAWQGDKAQKGNPQRSNLQGENCCNFQDMPVKNCISCWIRITILSKPMYTWVLTIFVMRTHQEIQFSKPYPEVPTTFL